MIKFDYYHNYSLKLKKLTYIESNPLGLVNNGNTCFINSILQCLFYTTSLTDSFMNFNVDYNKNIKDRAMVSLYIDLLNNFLTSIHVINPFRLVKCIKSSSSEFNNSYQQDSHEFLLFFLNTLHSQIKTKVDMNLSGSVVTQSDQLVKESMEFYKKTYKDDYSFIISSFHGLQYHTFNCLCKPRHIFEPFMDHCLEVDTHSDVMQMLAEFFGKKNLDLCNVCKTSIKQSISLWNIPDYFIINLKRYKHNTNGTTNYNDKLITFPFKMNLNTLVSKDKKDPNNYMYRLYAVNYYTGNAQNGHYYSACKNLQDKWYLYDDANVKPIPITSNLVTKDAYILFYYRERI